MTDNICPYIERNGVCLEPAACFLSHQTMNTKVEDFVPAYQGQGEGEKQEVLKKLLDPKYAKKRLTKELGEIGADGSQNVFEGLLMAEERANCECCHGLFTQCNGDACKNLGVCYCMIVDEGDLSNKFKQIQLQEEEKKEEA